MERLLSICVVTMNRVNQLKEAIESCFASVLPENTEFIIIDNASTDNTEEIVKTIFSNSGYSLVYEKMKDNVGAGRGRNIAFAKATGKYVYSLDDDAYIPTEHYEDFFTESIRIMEDNPNIASLTTQIFDKAWNDNRMSINGIMISDDVYKVPSMCEGSNFLRRDFFKSPPYFPNMYGYEGLPPVLEIYDKNSLNCFYSAVKAIHDPLVNKWDKSEKNKRIFIIECAVPYAIKKKMYPGIFGVILYLAYKLRCRKHLGSFNDVNNELKSVIKGTYKNARDLKRIKFKTVISLYRDFGKTIF